MHIITELHCHTRHSDGSFTVPELLETAKADGLQCIALTDHNTDSGCQELLPELTGRTVPAIHGFEWTTYFGHMVVLDRKSFVDWRFATPDNIDEKMAQIKAAGGLIGVAHPFRPGSPFCTGCCWDFNLKDWRLPDYIEIWSGSDPYNDIYNKKAYEFWLSLLDKGIHIAISHGKDWHRPDSTRQLDGFTILDILKQDITPAACLEAIEAGRTAVSIGAMIKLFVVANNQHYTLGDTAPKGAIMVSIEATLDTTRSAITALFDMTILRVELISNHETILYSFDIAAGETSALVNIDGDYIFARVVGTVAQNETVLAITSPIYFSGEANA